MPYPHQYIKLTEEEQKIVSAKLKEFSIKGRYKKRRILQILWLSDQGCTFQSITQRVKLSYPTVRRWVYRYRKDGLNPFL